MDIGYESGRRPDNIELAEPKEDALRRDFTINGLFFDPLEERIIDYVGGIEDIQKGVVRAIGNPDERFVEDRLRMIRAIRFASRFGFVIDEDTQVGIALNADNLFPAVAMERIWQEFNKMAAYPHFDQALIEMHRLKLLPVIFPSLTSLHLNEIKHRVAVLPQFPSECNTILFLMELFPQANLEEQLNICRYLKISKRDMELVEFTHRFRQKINEELLRLNGEDLMEWGYVYSNPHACTCLQVIATRFPHEIRTSILEQHKQRQEFLSPHIERIIQKKPVVTALILRQHGILPGKTMGMLLKEAEKIAINYNLHEAEKIIDKLKQSPLWFER